MAKRCIQYKNMVEHITVNYEMLKALKVLFNHHIYHVI